MHEVWQTFVGHAVSVKGLVSSEMKTPYSQVEVYKHFTGTS
jgi:hypothetical protein